MPILGKWALPTSASRSSDTSDSTSTSIINKILHGRVTKPAHTKSASSVEVTKYKDVVENSDDKEKGEGNQTTTPAKQIYEGVNEQRQEEGDNDREDGEERFSTKPPFALTVHPTSPKTPSSSILAEQQSDLEGGLDDDTDSEPDVYSEPDVDTAWRLEQIYLNTILNARNEFTLMPSTWRMHFRGIPLPDSLFYVKTKQKSIRPRIYARTDRLEYRGALALRKLIDVHARIQDIRDSEAAVQHNKLMAKEKKKELMGSMSTDMTKQLRRALEQALDWAKKDGNIDNYGDQFPPNTKIMELKGITVTDQPESETKIQTEMCCLAGEWRTHAANAKVNEGTPAQPPVVFGFVIMKHIITIVTLDAADPGAIIHVPCQLHMAERNQHQWNALAILVTICWARDVLLEYISARPDLQPEVKPESSDPDA
ncbi:hypothetical protein F4861DRAFT_526510 [Xylaria intraflava]|nr:hypothetical protein F4861DRAFT_526510 [Xylaria intraflava]